LTPFEPSLISSIKEKPDFYGPFWILTFYTFLIVVASNIISRTSKDQEDLMFNIKLLTYSACASYGFGITTPILVQLYRKFALDHSVSIF